MGNFFGKTTHLHKTTIRKVPLKGLHGNQKFHIPLWSMIYVALKFILSISETEFNFNSK